MFISHSSIASYTICPGLHKTPSMTILTQIPSRCFYDFFDDAVALIIKHRLGALCQPNLTQPMPSSTSSSGARTGLSLGQSWDLQHLDSSICHLYYIDLFLPFGLCSSPALFNKYMGALQYAMKTNNVQNLLHYLDDYFTLGPPHSPVCTNNIVTMIATCKKLDFALLIQKKSQKHLQPQTS